MELLKIKVCGMTDMQQVEQLAAMGADYAGFIFYEKSPRFAGNKLAAADLKGFASIQKVGVFVNESVDVILQTVDEYGLNAVQLHGDETADFCSGIKGKVTVIKAFRVKGDEDLSEILKPYEKAADYFLFDTKAQEYGGTGKKFDWSVLSKGNITKPYFLSGGIGMDDMEQVKQFTLTNNVFALDVNSKFETAPGTKDMESVKKFLRGIK
ncbi:MAG: phosphoribosylanthranilate isomerase [Niabella sp.]